jgi:hypothetical protein
MTVCPVALAVGCRRCAVFAICPLKGVIGDQSKPASVDEPAAKATKKKPRSR